MGGHGNIETPIRKRKVRAGAKVLLPARIDFKHLLRIVESRRQNEPFLE
jgi:hypothetical protein